MRAHTRDHRIPVPIAVIKAIGIEPFDPKSEGQPVHLVRCPENDQWYDSTPIMEWLANSLRKLDPRKTGHSILDGDT